MQQPALANATGLSRTSLNPERAMMVLDLLLSDKEINNLAQYGIQGRNYDLDEEGNFIRPGSYDESKDSYSVGTWNLNVDDLHCPTRWTIPAKQS